MRPNQDQFVRETEARDEAVQRVMNRLGHGAEEIDLKALLALLPEPPAQAAARVRNRVLLSRERPSPFPWASAGLAVAVALLLIWRLAGSAEPEPVSDLAVSTPERNAELSDASEVPPVIEPEPLQAESLVDSGERQVLEPVPGLKLGFQGTGSVEGTAQSPRVQWHSGSLDLEVDPEASLSVTVETAEGRVRVLGTVFSVERTALGTRIEVSRGKVQVDCEDGSAHTLMKGSQALCLPMSGAGMLGRARALSGEPEAVIQSIDRGLGLSPSSAISSELIALRVETLVVLGRNVEALVAARKYLVSGGPREMEILRTAASIALVEEGCEGALSYLERLAATQPDAARYHEECKERIRTETPQ